MSSRSVTDGLAHTLNDVSLLERRGRVAQAFGTTIRASGLKVRIGQVCIIADPASHQRISAEVVGFDADMALLTPLMPLHGLSQEAEVIEGPILSEIPVGPALLGRVIDAHGNPLDNLGPIAGPLQPRPIHAEPPSPMTRRSIDTIFPTGIRAIDGLISVGVGQRVGVFATAGGGKSTLLGMLGRHSQGDINVIALVGERGREVREFLDQALGAEGLKRSVVVVSTSDRPAMERVRAAKAATAIAEYFRDQGKAVVLMMDSVTRYARALREVGLSVGEPPVRRGFPPSVFAELPRLFERTGAAETGSITAFYTVLLEDEDGGDPVGEEVRSILDGHIYLSRRLAESGRFPAIDVAASLSRVFPQLADQSHAQAATRVRGWLGKYADIEFLVQTGEYKPGGDVAADEALARLPNIEAFLRQTPDDGCGIHTVLARLQAVAE